MKKASLAAATLAILVTAAVAAAPAAKKHAAKGKDKADVIMPADQLAWEPGPVPGTKVAKLWGDWTKGGAYGHLIKFDAGLMHPLHHHTQTLKIVVLAGTFVHQPEGGTETRLGPGSYLVQAGGKNHVSGCAAGAECEFFMMSNDKFDMTNVDEGAEKK